MGNSLQLLFKGRTFTPLFLTQFFGAFNDNAFKLAMLTLISYHLSKTQIQSETIQALAGALFIVPFFLFSATAGQLADKYDKAILTRYVKVLELVLMVIGAISLHTGNILLMMLTLTGIGAHSTFFGPIKYAILPDHLAKRQLLTATAIIEASTFLAIFLGTTLGTLSIGSAKPHVAYATIMTNVVAIFGLISSFFIPKALGKSPNLKINWHFWRATRSLLKNVMDNKAVFPAILAISWFWLIGAVIITKLPDFTHYVLGANTRVFALFLALFSIGIASGSLAVSRMLKGHITLRYVPITMLLLSVFATDIYCASPTMNQSGHDLQTLSQFLTTWSNWRITIDLFLFSFSGGLFIVPLYTFLQVSCDESIRARIIAANNIYNAMFMVLGSIIIMIMLKLNLNISLVFLILAIINVIAAFGIGLLMWFCSTARHATNP